MVFAKQIRKALDSNKGAKPCTQGSKLIKETRNSNLPSDINTAGETLVLVQRFSTLVPCCTTCMVHLLEVLLDVTDDNVIASYFGTERQMQCNKD